MFRIERGGRFQGVALAGYSQIKGRQDGWTIGVINYAHDLGGVQIGLINIAKSTRRRRESCHSSTRTSRSSKEPGSGKRETGSGMRTGTGNGEPGTVTPRGASVPGSLIPVPSISASRHFSSESSSTPHPT
jgi:hypothetical protein